MRLPGETTNPTRAGARGRNHAGLRGLCACALLCAIALITRTAGAQSMQDVLRDLDEYRATPATFSAVATVTRGGRPVIVSIECAGDLRLIDTDGAEIAAASPELKLTLLLLESKPLDDSLAAFGWELPHNDLGYVVRELDGETLTLRAIGEHGGTRILADAGLHRLRRVDIVIDGSRWAASVTEWSAAANEWIPGHIRVTRDGEPVLALELLQIVPDQAERPEAHIEVLSTPRVFPRWTL